MRNCDDCSVCCVVASIAEGIVDSPAGQPCEHLCPEGCGLVGMDSRPAVCNSFMCAWLRGVGREDHRPDLIGAMFSVNKTENGLIGFAMETKRNAVETTAKEMAIIFAKTFDMPLIVSKFGKLPPNDTGDYLVIRDELHPKAHAIAGLPVCRLSNDVGMYEFTRAVA